MELGLTQQEAADRGSVSLATWRLVESAGRDRYQDLTLRGICKALDWRPDAVELLLDPEHVTDDTHEQAASLAAPEITARPGDHEHVPAGLLRKWADLTPHEQSLVQGFVEGLLASRRP